VTSLSPSLDQTKLSIFSRLDDLRKPSAILHPVIMTIVMPRAYGHSVVHGAGLSFRVSSIGCAPGEQDEAKK
jgi:hypothetical protein